jgi:flagellar basal body-associated protein FliL
MNQAPRRHRLTSLCINLIVWAVAALVTGCGAPFWKSPNTTVDDAVQAVDTPSFRSDQVSSSENKQSFFFNDKSREIERSLGL